MAKPLILVSNDDGITSAGIRNLVEVMKQLGDVLVVAPDSPQSGKGHAITVGESLRLDETSIFEGVRSFECSGTPADCVKIARHFVLKDEREPDVIVSGINHGSNTSISVLYSGTMSAAIEGAIEGTQENNRASIKKRTAEGSCLECQLPADETGTHQGDPHLSPGQREVGGRI